LFSKDTQKLVKPNSKEREGSKKKVSTSVRMCERERERVGMREKVK
jgi:hypothetical protein